MMLIIERITSIKLNNLPDQQTLSRKEAQVDTFVRSLVAPWTVCTGVFRVTC
jgi:hypothetical protein